MENSGSLLILGNGHNLGMGLRTSYANFAEHYLCDISKYPNSKLYHHLCSSFQKSSNYKQLWGDLETEILRFVTTIDWRDCNIQEEYNYFECLRSNMGFYMDGEAKYKLLGGLYNAIEGFDNNDLILNSLPICLFQYMLRQDRRYDIISFNYTRLEYIFYKITSNLLGIDDNSPFMNNRVVTFYKERVNLDYVHISGAKCVLGTSNDSRIPQAFSFVKKASQFSMQDGYPDTFSNYKTIIIYGHSLGESDADFIHRLFNNILLSKEPPLILLVTQDESSLRKINENLLTLFPKSDINSIIKFDNILLNKNSYMVSKKKLEEYLNT